MVIFLRHTPKIAQLAGQQIKASKLKCKIGFENGQIMTYPRPRFNLNVNYPNRKWLAILFELDRVTGLRKANYSGTVFLHIR